MKPFPPDQLADALALITYETFRHAERMFARAAELAAADPSLEPHALVAQQRLIDARDRLAEAVLARRPGEPHALMRVGRQVVVASRDPLGVDPPTVRVLLLPPLIETLVRGGAIDDLTARPEPPADGEPESQQ